MEKKGGPWKELVEIYRWIRGYLELDERKDILSREILKNLLPENSLEPLEKMLSGKRVLVVGAGPSLKKEFYRVEPDVETLIAADGASRFLYEEGVYPDIVVTDLDGINEFLIKKLGKNPVYVIHAHGDNIETIRKLVPLILQFDREGVYGTTQVDPSPPVFNFGGFTDGDRGVFISYLFGAKKILLAGMDFGDFVGRYSKPYLQKNIRAGITKRKKLYIAKKLLLWLYCNGAPILWKYTHDDCRVVFPWKTRQK
jgi:uncharacterized Rossmann fold enzyme